MKKAFLVILLFISFIGNSANISIRLVIKNGDLVFNNGTTIPYKIYTSSDTFAKNSDLLIWETGDMITLKVVNETLENHGFTIDGYVNYGTILPGDSVQQTFASLTEGVFRYYDPLNFPYNQYLGLSGVVHVKSPTDPMPYFYWEIREHMSIWNSDIILGNLPPVNQYYPNYFTINGNSEPEINSDVVAHVTGSVGNELRIVIVNNGISIHSMHLHGYHALLMMNSKNNDHVGRSKDTFPVYPKESIILSITPDKPGEYPVHDHNLITVTGGGIYHAGIFTTLLIAP